MAKSFREVAKFPSSSDPSKEYTVSVDETGALSCDCRGWTIKKPGQERTCQHVREVARQGQVAPAPQPVQAGGGEKGGSLTKMFGKWEDN